MERMSAILTRRHVNRHAADAIRCFRPPPLVQAAGGEPLMDTNGRQERNGSSGISIPSMRFLPYAFIGSQFTAGSQQLRASGNSLQCNRGYMKKGGRGVAMDGQVIDEAAAQPPAYSLTQLVGYALGLGTWGFGGPVALVGYMHRDLVERRKWISEAEYKEGLTLAQIMPGPLAAQLAIYLGYVHYGVLGATLVGVAFVLPSFLMVLALGWAYQQYGGLSWMQAVFYGVGASVIGIIAISAYKLTRKTIGQDWLLWAIFLVERGWSRSSPNRKRSHSFWEPDY